MITEGSQWKPLKAVEAPEDLFSLSFQGRSVLLWTSDENKLKLSVEKVEGHAFAQIIGRHAK